MTLNVTAPMIPLEKLQQKITDKAHTIGIIGLGYVGLPLVNATCKRNIKTLGFDVDPKKIDALNNGQSYIGGVEDKDIAAHIEKNLFQPYSNFSKLTETDVIIICVPTPLDLNEAPDLSYVENTTQAIADHLQDGQLIILESTTYPGTVKDIMRPILEQAATTKNITYYLAYSPEREDPGNKDFATSSTPKIVGAESPEVLGVTVTFYEQFIEKIIPVSSIEVAEATKITENVFRAVNIALVNELKLIYDKMDIDIWEVIEAAKTKPFGYMPFYPGPGIGGHCIPIDPIYLSWKAANIGQNTEFIELAAKINQSMPDHICEKLLKGLKRDTLADLKDTKIMIIGVAYKKNVSDQRESPAFPLMKKLASHGATMAFNDPHIPAILPNRHHPEFNGQISTPLTPETITAQDAIIIVTNHDTINYDELLKHATLIIDTRNTYPNSPHTVIKA